MWMCLCQYLFGLLFNSYCCTITVPWSVFLGMNCYSPFLELWSQCQWSVMLFPRSDHWSEIQTLWVWIFLGISWNRQRHQAAAQMGRPLGSWHDWRMEQMRHFGVSVFIIHCPCVHMPRSVSNLPFSNFSNVDYSVSNILKIFAVDEDVNICTAKSRLAFSTST